MKESLPQGKSPWRTLITAVHPHPSVKINHGATFVTQMIAILLSR